MHGHSPAGEPKASEARSGAHYHARLLAAFAVIAGFFLVEAIGGILTGSLALLSDAAHMFTDVIGLGMALAAIRVANRRVTSSQQTFGLYRLEVLAAGANAVLLLGVGLYILYEAYQRVRDPAQIASGPMLWIAVLGLLANLVAFGLLREGAKESINVQGAFLEVLSDTLGSTGVIIAALVIRLTGWTIVDPLIAAAIGLFVVPRTLSLGRQALRILMQHAPERVGIDALTARLRTLSGVAGAHDVHVWTLTSGMDVGSAHLLLAPDASSTDVLTAAQSVFRDGFSIEHATIQIESGDGGCAQTRW